jgi:hypothetical protein
MNSPCEKLVRRRPKRTARPEEKEKCFMIFKKIKLAPEKPSCHHYFLTLIRANSEVKESTYPHSSEKF